MLLRTKAVHVFSSAMTEIPLIEGKLSYSFQHGMTESYMAIDDRNHSCAITEGNSAGRWWAGKLANKTVVTHVKLTMSRNYEGKQINTTKYIIAMKNSIPTCLMGPIY